MAAAKLQRTPQEVEDIILRKMFLISLTDATGNDPRVVYVELTAAVMLSEGKELRLSRDMMEDIMMDRLSGSYSSVESPFQYLIGCSERAHDEGKKIANMKDKILRGEMESVVREAKKLCVILCRMHLVNPGTFQSGNSSTSKHATTNTTFRTPLRANVAL